MLVNFALPSDAADGSLTHRQFRARVLVVNHMDAQRSRVAHALRAEGFEVVEAASGATALELARQMSFDVVVLDVDLPDIDGFEICRRLKAAATSMLPVLHLSASSTSAVDRARGLDAGADAYMVYPFDANELRASVSGMVRLKRNEPRRLADAEAAAQLSDTLDALPVHIALLGSTGDVVAVNRAWASFAADNGYHGGGTGLGVNYCAVCDAATGEGSAEARAAATGIRKLLAGEIDSFAHEYPCHSPTAERYFRMVARRVAHGGAVAAVVTHSERTRERLASRAAAEAHDKAEREHLARANEEAFFRALTERSLEFVSILDAEGRFTYVSPSSVRTIGYVAEELLGATPLTLVYPGDLDLLRQAFFTLTHGAPEAATEITARLRHKDGTWRSFEGTALNLMHDPAVGGLIFTLRDVTGRIEAERARQESDTRFQRFVETAHEGVLALDTTGVITYANPRAGSLLGCPVDTLPGRPLFEFIPPHEVKDVRERIARRWQAGPDTVELTMRRRDGAVVEMLTSVSPILDEDGEVSGVLAMLSDVSERRRAERATASALQAADLDRRRLGATLRAIPVGVWLADSTGALTHINPAAAEIWGASGPGDEGVTQYGAYRTWSPETGAPIPHERRALPRALATRRRITGEVIGIERFDGTRGFVLNSAAPILGASGEVTGAVVVDVDVTAPQAATLEREGLLATLGSERAQLAAVFDQAPGFIAVLSGADYVFERANPALQELVGGRATIGETVASALPELVEQGVVELLDHVRETGESYVGRQMPVELERTPGAPLETRYVDIVYQRLTTPEGEHTLVSQGVDVTEQVLATRNLRRNQERLREQFEKLPVPTFLWEDRGEDFALLEVNEAARTAMPQFCADALGHRARQILTGRVVADDLRRCLAENIVLRRNIEFNTGAPLGERRFDLTFGPQQPDRVLLHAVDITERSELEAQLRQAQKMDAIGRLAGGVAHDFNNLLTVISAHSAFLLESLDASDPQREDAEAIHKAGVRAAGLTRQLLAFSRKQLLKPTVLDLNAIVLEMRLMLVRLLGEDIEIVTHLSEGMARVIADPTQIDQVIVNLAVNARDAMSAGGRLTIVTRMATIGSDVRDVQRILPAGDYAVLTVQDTGTGMDAGVRARLFEPFFTTKAQGKGTGLGLATVYGIVKQSGGYITVESTPGEGSTFAVYLPVVTGEETAGQMEEAQRAVARGVETVLLVEDEPAVRAVAKRILRRQGYVVLEAEDGYAALSISADFSSTIHLVVSDAVMPGMGGAEVVRRLQEQRPGLRALFMSGYTDDEIVRRGIVSSSMPFVQKPFTSLDFARAVREALDDSPASKP